MPPFVLSAGGIADWVDQGIVRREHADSSGRDGRGCTGGGAGLSFYGFGGDFGDPISDRQVRTMCHGL